MLLFTAISLKSVQKICVTDTENKQASKLHVEHERLVFPRFAAFMAWAHLYVKPATLYLLTNNMDDSVQPVSCVPQENRDSAWLVLLFTHKAVWNLCF